MKTETYYLNCLINIFGVQMEYMNMLHSITTFKNGDKYLLFPKSKMNTNTLFSKGQKD